MPTLIESLGRMAALEEKLKELGVPPDAIENVMAHIDVYVELRDGLDAARSSQFHDNAFDFLGEVKQASNKNVDALAVWLRKFAVYVAVQTISLTQVHGGDASAIVDRIPPMNEEDDHGEDA